MLQGCYSSCGSRLKLSRDGGTLYSVGGNPYNPSCANPYLPFEAPLEDAYRSMSYANGYGNSTRGTSCGRGQATQDGYGQPDRITMPLKRAGARGEGKWKPISWDQLIKEVTEGGKLFADIGKTKIEGFLSIHDTETPINPDEPTLGPKSNQFVLLGGRGDGRTTFGGRYRTASGSVDQCIRLHLRRLRKCEFVLSNWVPFPSPRRIRRRIHPVAGHRTWN